MLSMESALKQLLNGWKDYEQDFPVAAASIAIPVLVNRMGTLSPDSVGMLGLSPRIKARRVVLRLLRRFETPEDLIASMPYDGREGRHFVWLVSIGRNDRAPPVDRT